MNLDDFFPMLGQRRQKTEPLPKLPNYCPDAASLPVQGARMNSAPLPPPLPNLPPIKTKVARTATATVATAYAHDEGAPVGPDDMGQHVRKKRGYVMASQEQPYVIAYPVQNGSIPGVLQYAPQQLAGGVAEQQQYAYLTVPPQQIAAPGLNAAPIMGAHYGGLANQSFDELAVLSDLVNTELANRKIASVAAAESHRVIPPVKLEAYYPTAAAVSSEHLTSSVPPPPPPLRVSDPPPPPPPPPVLAPTSVSAHDEDDLRVLDCNTMDQRWGSSALTLQQGRLIPVNGKSIAPPTTNDQLLYREGDVDDGRRLARCPPCRTRKVGSCGGARATSRCYRLIGLWEPRKTALAAPGKKVLRTGMRDADAAALARAFGIDGIPGSEEDTLEH